MREIPPENGSINENHKIRYLIKKRRRRRRNKIHFVQNTKCFTVKYPVKLYGKIRWCSSTLATLIDFMLLHLQHSKFDKFTFELYGHCISIFVLFFPTFSKKREKNSLQMFFFLSYSHTHTPPFISGKKTSHVIENMFILANVSCSICYTAAFQSQCWCWSLFYASPTSILYVHTYMVYLFIRLHTYSHTHSFAHFFWSNGLV